MNNYTTIAVSALALIVAAAPGSANAADVYSSGGMKDKVYAEAPAPTWTGFLVGVSAVGAFVNHDITFDSPQGTLAELNGASGIGPGAGFLVGFRYQFPQSRLVFGVEASYDIISAPVDLTAGGTNIASLELTGKWDIVGTAGLVVSPHTLVYVGAGYGQAFYQSSGLPGVHTVVGDPTIDGAVFKAGLETKLPWIASGAFARGEWDFFSANQTTLVDSRYLRPGYAINDIANINEVKFTVGYQFGTGNTPLESFK